MRGKYLFTLPLLLLFTFLLTSGESQAAYIIQPETSGTITRKPVPEYLTPEIVMQLSPTEFAAVSGKKLNFLERMIFKRLQKRMGRNHLQNPDHVIPSYGDPIKAKFRLNVLWFVLGIIIGPLAILFALTTKEKKMSLRSAFLGFLVFVLWFGFLFVF